MSTTQTVPPPEGSEVGKDNRNNNKGRRKNRQGKASKARNDEQYRMRMNEIERRQHQSYLDRVLCVNKNEDTKPLKRVMEDMRTPQRPVAKPISVTTRGIGFSTTIFYDRAMTTWSARALWDICTIHQVYRVGLWLVHYKLYLSHSIQSEQPAITNALSRVFIEDEYRSILEPLHLVPSVWGLILDSVGKITADQVYHSGYSERPADAAEQLEWLILSCNPTNIRELLDSINPQNLAAFQLFNPIPGVRFGPLGIINADDIYPADYNAQQLRNDVSCYLNLLTRIQHRLPKHSLIDYEMSGVGLKAGFWSCAPIPISNHATYGSTSSVSYVPSVRNARGKRITTQRAVETRTYFYQRSVIRSMITPFWSIGITDDDDVLTGCMSLVGEECNLGTRYQMNAKTRADLDPITVMYALLDAPK